MSDESFSSLDGDRRKELDAEQIGPSGEEVLRQRIQVTGDALAKIAEVTNAAPSASAYGLVVRFAGGGGTGTTVDQGAPNSLANGWPVKITDGTSVLGTVANPLRVDPTTSSAAVVTPVAAPVTTATTVLLAANPARRGLVIHNNHATRFLYVKLGTLGSATDHSNRIPPRGTWELEQPVYTGDISGAWTAGTGGTAQVTELT